LNKDIRDVLAVVIGGIICLILGFIALFFICQIPFWIGSKMSKGIGQYTGTVVETQYHGLIFKTYAVQLKTGGYTPRFEDFCILDSNIYNQLASMPRSKEVTVTYKKLLSTTSWQCAGEDSSDVVTAVKVEN
jgi:hypothetical protein